MYIVQKVDFFLYMYLEEFRSYLIHERNYSTHTIKVYVVDVQGFVDFLQAHNSMVDIDRVEYLDIRKWIIHLVDSGISNRSVNRKIASLKAYYKFLQRIEVREGNPLSYHQPLKVDAKIQVPFSKKEMEKVFEQPLDSANFNSVRNLLIIGLLYATGIRRTELIDLKLSSLYIRERKIQVLGKGNKERLVPLLPWCVELIEDYLELRRKLPKAIKTDLLLLTEKGKPIYPSLVYRVVQDTFKQISGKQTKSPHIIRHTFATHLLDEGADLMAIKELLGHASLASTQVYTHNSMQKLKQVYKTAHPRNMKK